MPQSLSQGRLGTIVDLDTFLGKVSDPYDVEPQVIKTSNESGRGCGYVNGSTHLFITTRPRVRSGLFSVYIHFRPLTVMQDVQIPSNVLS